MLEQMEENVQFKELSEKSNKEWYMYVFEYQFFLALMYLVNYPKYFNNTNNTK